MNKFIAEMKGYDEFTHLPNPDIIPDFKRDDELKNYINQKSREQNYKVSREPEIV